MPVRLRSQEPSEISASEKIGVKSVDLKQLGRVRDDLFEWFINMDSLKDIKIDHEGKIETYENARNVLKKHLDYICKRSDHRGWYGQYFLLSDARWKDWKSLRLKLFRKAWKRAGFDKAPPESANPATLSLMADDPTIISMYRDVHDFVGGRISIGYLEDIFVSVRRLRMQLELLGYEVRRPSVRDDAHVKNRQESGYYAYHFHVKVPLTDPFEGQFVLAEIQVHTMMSTSFVLIGHDLIYKPTEPGQGILPTSIHADMRLMSDSMILNDRFFESIRRRLKETLPISGVA